MGRGGFIFTCGKLVDELLCQCKKLALRKGCSGTGFCCRCSYCFGAACEEGKQADQGGDATENAHKFLKMIQGVS
jgi:hypothetical protein